MCQLARPLVNLASLVLALFSATAKGCFPLTPFGSCAGGGTFCSPTYSAPMPGYSYPDAAYPAYPASYGPYGQPYHASASASKSRTMPSLDSCLRRFPDMRVTCALPFERRTATSDERECQRHCSDAAPRCRSFQYDSVGTVCDLFEHTLASESAYAAQTYEPSDGWKHTAKKGRRERRFVFNNGVPLDRHSQSLASPPMRAAAGVQTQFSQPSLSSCVPTLEPRTGVIFTGLEPGCEPAGLFPLLDDEDADEVPLPPPAPSPSPAPSTVGQLEPMPAVSQWSTTTSRKAAAAAFVESTTLGSHREEGDCPDGGRARVQLIDGISLVGARLVTAIQLDSADACLHVCRQNAHIDGRRFPGHCRSATFHRQSGRCEILAEAISPNGQLQYVPNPDSLYFEKICIPQGDLPLGCDDVIHRIPQHHLDPRPVAGSGTVVSAPNQLECVRACIAAKARLGFECASASFFFDWPTQNCFLNRFTRLSRPDLYKAERKKLVDYLEMPPCFQLAGVRQHDAPASGWSACIGGFRWRKRANCTTTNCTESEACSSGANNNDVAKAVAPSIEVARRFQPPSVASDEASLFGEQDYENQKEISFFGPPQPPAVGAASTTASVDDEDVGDEEQSQNKVLPAVSPSRTCDPAQECCPLEEGTGPGGAIVRGCSLGTRTLLDGRRVSCVPDKCQ